MARPSLRRSAGGNRYPFWIAALSLVGLSMVYRRVMPEDVSEPDAGATPAPASAAPASDAPPMEGPTLTWRTEGVRDLPPPPELLACLAGHTGRTPALAPVRTGETFATEISWLGPPVRQRLEASGAAESPGLIARTSISGRPHAALAAHLALGACMRPGATSLLDAELGRKYGPGDWPAPLPGGGLDVASLFAQELRGGLLVSRGLARLGLPELAVQPAAGQDTESVRVQLQKAIVAAVVAGAVGERLTIDDAAVALRPMTLTGLGDVRVLTVAPPRRPDAGPRRPGPPGSRATSEAPPARPSAAPTAQPLNIDYR